MCIHAFPKGEVLSEFGQCGVRDVTRISRCEAKVISQTVSATDSFFFLTVFLIIREEQTRYHRFSEASGRRTLVKGIPTPWGSISSHETLTCLSNPGVESVSPFWSQLRQMQSITVRIPCPRHILTNRCIFIPFYNSSFVRLLVGQNQGMCVHAFSQCYQCSMMAACFS